MPPVAIGVGVPALIFLSPSGLPVTGVHNSYPILLAGPLGGVAMPADPEVPHLPELPLTFSTPMVTAGTTVPTSTTGLLENQWWYSLYGPNLTGD